jgi:hypothetical protein
VQLAVDVGQVQLERRRHHRLAPVCRCERFAHCRDRACHADKPLNVITVKDPDHRTALPLEAWPAAN